MDRSGDGAEITLACAIHLARIDAPRPHWPSAGLHASWLCARTQLCRLLRALFMRGGDTPAMRAAVEDQGALVLAALGCRRDAARERHPVALPAGPQQMTPDEAAGMLQRERPACQRPQGDIRDTETVPQAGAIRMLPPMSSPSDIDEMERLMGDLGDAVERGMRAAWRWLFSGRKR